MSRNDDRGLAPGGSAAEGRRGAEDVVLQQPEDVRFLVQVFHTPVACPGAATAYLLRRIAYRAGAYAPGIQEHIFHELHTSREGGSIEKVQLWFTSRGAALYELGYRLQFRRVCTPTSAILDWVRAGRGHRGAMLPTVFRRLHPAPGAGGTGADVASHAVGITIDRLTVKADEDLVMIDPWPGVQGDGAERSKPPATLELAHRERGMQALVYYWAGWS